MKPDKIKEVDEILTEIRAPHDPFAFLPNPFSFSPLFSFSPYNVDRHKPQTKQEILVQALERMFRKEIDNKDSKYLEDAVRQYEGEVYQTGNSGLMRAYAKACLFVGELNCAVRVYGQLHTNDREKSVLGIIAYHKGRFEEAFAYLKSTKEMTPEARLVLSAIHARNGQTHPAVYKGILKPILKESFVANIVLGIAHFNYEEFEEAEECFARATDMRPNSQIAGLNLMRAQYALGKESEFRGKIGEFYYNTNCQMTPDAIEKELRKRKIEFPMYKANINNLYEIV